ncbi:MICOS complex subunit MIC60 [Cladobotryum mycophilum]|uniref:MICOS complex subunit MIC60 n=1 Tax=Cladobotryum mycophilum TaxID=491253 RepID=A0ABR0SKL9_9HYPO
MLRSSLRTARILGSRPVAAAAGRQWSIAASRRAPVVGIVGLLQLPNINISRWEIVADKLEPRDPSPTRNLQMPRLLPSHLWLRLKALSAPRQQRQQHPPPHLPLPQRRGKEGLLSKGASGFAGGVWYSRINDSFHDFFTEYIPYGEQAVLYLEELEFKKKFPNAQTNVSRPRETGEKVTIPVQSGASWRVADQTEPAGRRSSAASSSSKPASKPEAKAEEAPKPAPPTTPTPVVKPAEKTAAKPAPAPQEKPTAPAAKLKSIDLMALPDAKEPIVRDLVHMLNDLILVINADGAHRKYGSTVEKAKNEIVNIGSRLKDLKTGVEKKAAEEVRSTVAEFEAAAADLIKRVENTMAQQEVSWREEFEEKKQSMREGYDERVKLLLEREQKLNEEKLHSKLLEQAVALKKDFLKEVEARVEQERESRIGKLNDLSAAVSDLEKLTLGWNKIVDSNLKTQQLHVAVEAVRASLEDGQHPRPFIRELVAIKEIASDDAVVDAAIASITPSAYQRGISTSAQLIDRFRRVSGEVRKASLLPDDAGVASHASSWVLSHVMFKKQGLAEGDDVESILTRTQTYLEEGDLDAATREMTGLQGWAKTLSKDWLAEARKVLEVQQALDVIATEARLQSLRVD